MTLKKHTKTNGPSQWTDPILFMIQVFIVLFFLYDQTFIKIDIRVYLITLLFGILLMAIHMLSGLYRKILMGVCGLFLISFGLFQIPEILEEITSIQESVSVTTVKIDTMLSLVLALLLVIFYWILFKAHRPFLYWLITTGLIGGILLLDPSISFGSCFLLFFLQILLWVKTSLNQPLTFSMVKKVLCFSVPVLILGFVLSGALEKPVFEWINHAETQLSHWARSGRHEPVSGVISRGNNHDSDTIVFTIKAYDPPKDTLYLKGFIGETYENETWTEDKETELVSEIRKHYSDYSSPYEIKNAYKRLERAVIRSMDSEPVTILLSSSVNNLEELTPYYSISSTTNRYRIYTYTNEQALDPYRSKESEEFAKLYEKAAQSVYTQVDTEAIPHLKQLVDSHPQKDLDSITATIAGILQENTEYSRSPGIASGNQNIVETFLFSRQKGYCVHYASTAVLMYRLYGIPARYVSGYTVSPDQFSSDLSANVRENQAHAWAEIYVDPYGWIPVDMTPDAQGRIRPEYPGLDTEKLEQALEENASQYKLAVSQTTSSRFNFDRIALLILILGIVVMLVLGIRKILWIKHKKRPKDDLTCILRILSVDPNFDRLRIDEKAFVDQLQKRFPSLTKEECLDLQEKLLLSLYADQKIDLSRFYRKLKKAVEQQLTFWEKLKYIGFMNDL